MEDTVIEQPTGVEHAEVADQQPEVTETQPDTATQTPETGVEDSPAAEVKDEKDFSKALNARAEQLRQKMEDEYKAKYEGYDSYKKQADLALRTARHYGFDDVESYERALEQAEQEQRISAEAQRLGVDEDVVRQYLQPLNEKVTGYEKELQELKHAESIRQIESRISAMEQDTVNFPGFGDHKEQVIGIAAERGYTLEDAYKLFAFDNQKLLDTIRQRAEQETIRKIQQNADGSPGSLGADAVSEPDGYLGMNPAERRAFREKVKAGQL